MICHCDRENTIIILDIFYDIFVAKLERLEYRNNTYLMQCPICRQYWEVDGQDNKKQLFAIKRASREEFNLFHNHDSVASIESIDDRPWKLEFDLSQILWTLAAVIYLFYSYFIHEVLFSFAVIKSLIIIYKIRKSFRSYIIENDRIIIKNFFLKPKIVFFEDINTVGYVTWSESGSSANYSSKFIITTHENIEYDLHDEQNLGRDEIGIKYPEMYNQFEAKLAQYSIEIIDINKN